MQLPKVQYKLRILIVIALSLVVVVSSMGSAKADYSSTQSSYDSSNSYNGSQNSSGSSWSSTSGNTTTSYYESGGTTYVTTTNNTGGGGGGGSYSGGWNPRGYLDSASCDVATGWACDNDNVSQPIRVDFYADGSGFGRALGSATANEYRQDLVNAGACNGNGSHGFTFAIPNSLKDGGVHYIYAYGINIGGGRNVGLNGNPKTIQCASLPPPPSFSPAVDITQSAAITYSNGTTGGTFTISWASFNAAYCVVAKHMPNGTVVNPWAVGIVGVQATSPAVVGTHHWWVACVGLNGGVVSSELWHTVKATPTAPTVSMTQSKTQTVSDGTTGESFDVSWSSSNATSCAVYKTLPGSSTPTQPFGTAGTSGTRSASPYIIGTHHFWVTCTGPGGSSTANIHHAVVPGTAPCVIAHGTSALVNGVCTLQSCDYGWHQNGNVCEQNQAGLSDICTDIPDDQKSVPQDCKAPSIPPGECIPAGYKWDGTKCVALPVISDFYANPDAVRTGSPTALHWEIANIPADGCTITSIPAGFSYGVNIASGSVTTGAISEPTNFTLSCGAGISKKILVSLIPAYKEI